MATILASDATITHTNITIHHIICIACMCDTPTRTHNSSPTSLAYRIHSSMPYNLRIFPFLFIITVPHHAQYSDSVSAVRFRTVVSSLINWMWPIFLKVLSIRSSCHLQESFRFWLPSRRVIGIGSCSWSTTFCLCCVVIAESKIIA